MNKIHRHTFHLTAGECDANGRISIPTLVERLIEVATEHANILGIGYSKLVTLNIGWVLSRLSLEMTSYPGINDTYHISTWIETINRRFSERNMTIQDDAGKIIGYARTIWVGINFKTRTMGDLSGISDSPIPVSSTACPIAKMPKPGTLSSDSRVHEYRFGFSDLDFNRHVNTVRYIGLILNQWSLTHFDKFMVRRMDVSFSKECYFNDSVHIITEDTEKYSLCELIRDAEKAVTARFIWHPRELMFTPFQPL